MMTSVLELAETIASMSPVAIQGTKINLNYARDHTVEEGLDFVVSTVGEVSSVYISVIPKFRKILQDTLASIGT